MSKPFRKIVQDLQWLNFWIRHCCDQAEAKVREVNKLVRELGENGFVNETVILGSVIHHRYYAPQPGGSDSGQLVQAVLHVPHGYGVALWDTEDYAALNEVSQGLESEILPSICALRLV